MMNTEVATITTPVNLEHITSLEQAWQVCQMISQSTLVPESLRNKPANVLLVYMTGRELGLTFAQSLRGIYIASAGQPQLRGVLLLALIRRAGHDYWFDQAEGSCTCHIKRGDGGREFEATFTLEDAEAAELVKRNADGNLVAYSQGSRKLPWMTYQRNMLRWRSVAEAANIAVPEVMMGFDVMDYASPNDQPEVDLKPAARPAADEGPQPAGSPGEDAAAELAGLDARGAAASPGEEPAREVTSTPPAPARPEPKELPSGQVTAGQRAKQQLAEKFNQLGWTFGEDKDEILGALTAFTRRVIVMPGNLTPKEATALSAQLAKIIATTEPDHYLVALSEAIDGWEHDWQDADPDGFDRDYVHVTAGRN